MEGTIINKISLVDSSQINGGGSTTDWGGVAYMKGQNNYLAIINGASVSQCSAIKGAGCFYFGGSQINDVQIVSGALGQSSIGSVLLSSTNAADACNGGVFYMIGKKQTFNLTGSLISDVSTKGYGGIIFSQP